MKSGPRNVEFMPGGKSMSKQILGILANANRSSDAVFVNQRARLYFLNLFEL